MNRKKSERPSTNSNQLPQLSPVRCGNCSRFLGYEMLVQGIIFLRCSNCKEFNQLMSPDFPCPLTDEEIYATLNKRTKGQKDQGISPQ